MRQREKGRPCGPPSGSKVGDARFLGADPCTCFTLNDCFNICQCANDCGVAGFTGKLAGGFYLRPHRTRGEAKFFQLARIGWRHEKPEETRACVVDQEIDRGCRVDEPRSDPCNALVGREVAAGGEGVRRVEADADPLRRLEPPADRGELLERRIVRSGGKELARELEAEGYGAVVAGAGA